MNYDGSMNKVKWIQGTVADYVVFSCSPTRPNVTVELINSKDEVSEGLFLQFFVCLIEVLNAKGFSYFFYFILCGFYCRWIMYICKFSSLLFSLLLPIFIFRLLSMTRVQSRVFVHSHQSSGSRIH